MQELPVRKDISCPGEGRAGSLQTCAGFKLISVDSKQPDSTPKTVLSQYLILGASEMTPARHVIRSLKKSYWGGRRHVS